MHATKSSGWMFDGEVSTSESIWFKALIIPNGYNQKELTN